MAESCLELSVGCQGKTREFRVEASSLLLGSAPHCEIQLSSAEVASEQLEFRRTGDSVVALVRSQEPAVTLNGAPFVGGRLASGTVLSVGRISVAVRVVPVAGRGDGRGAAAGRWRLSLLGLLAVAALLVAVYARLTRARSATSEASAVEPPPLFEAGESACPEREGAAAGAAAEQYASRAALARERSPFKPEEGVSAVQLFGTAADCFRRSGAAESARAQASAAARLRKQLEADFHVHQVRLERALVEERHDDARVELDLLRSFLLGREGEYTTWLTNAARGLDAARAEVRRP